MIGGVIVGTIIIVGAAEVSLRRLRVTTRDHVWFWMDVMIVRLACITLVFWGLFAERA
jgi:hypothetical protein